jgi:GT2 family glycosyltransferase
LGQLVSVVLVTWNSAPFLRRCLDGLARQTHPEVELLVVDNASTDGSAELVAPHATRIIRNDVNRGFSAAVNQAIAVSHGAFVLLLNPDCHLEPEYIAFLIGALEEKNTGSATGLLMRARGAEIEPTAVVDSAGMRMTRNGRHLDITERPSATTEVFGVSGAAAMFRRDFLEDVAVDGELLDEDFFAYREDADLAWRARLLGWRAVCEPRAVASHVRRVTPEGRRELPADINMHSVKNRFLLRLKNQGPYLALRNLPFELARDLVVVAAALTVERSSLPALAWLWRNRARVLAKRRVIQSRRKVSDRELARWFR